MGTGTAERFGLGAISKAVSGSDVETAGWLVTTCRRVGGHLRNCSKMRETRRTMQIGNRAGPWIRLCRFCRLSAGRENRYQTQDSERFARFSSREAPGVWRLGGLPWRLPFGKTRNKQEINRKRSLHAPAEESEISTLSTLKKRAKIIGTMGLSKKNKKLDETLLHTHEGRTLRNRQRCRI